MKRPLALQIARALTCGLALALCTLSAAPAAAGEPPPCALASVIGELTPSEERALTQACEGAEVAEADLHAAVFHMVSLSGWRSAALARLLAPLRGQGSRMFRRAGVDTPDLPKIQSTLTVRPEALAGPDCAALRGSVDAFVADTQTGEAAVSPFLHDDPALLRCLGAPAAALDGVRLVALRADNVDELFVAAAAPDFAYVAWLHPRDAVDFGRQRFFVVAAPPDAPMTAVARVRNVEVPAIWREIVSYDAVAWAESPPLTCVNLDVRLGPSATVYVDGAPIPRDESGVSRVLAVTRDEHEIVAVECPEGAASCHVRYREGLPAAALQRRTNQCLGVRLDIAARTRPTVAVLDATQGATCSEAPLRSDGLRQGAADHLTHGPSKKTHEFRDLAAFAAATDALSALRTRLQRSGEVAVAAGGGADGVDLLGSAAKEAWRQGIDILLSFDLQCVRRGEGWAYQLMATRVALSSMFSRGRYSGRALDLSSFIETVTEEFYAVDHLPLALASVLDRSLSTPYLRLLIADVAHPSRTGADLTVQHYRGGVCEACKEGDDRGCRERCAAPVVVAARRLTIGGTQPAVCRSLAERRPSPELLRAAQQAFDGGSGRPLTLPIRRGAGGVDGDLVGRRDVAHLRGGVPGWYVVVARWADDGAPRDAACLELTAPQREVWGDVTLAIGDLHIAPDAAPDELYMRARAGYLYYLKPYLGVGAVFGYAYTAYSWDSRPAWQDFDEVYDDRLEWSRHALLVGGPVELRTRFASFPFDLRLRAVPTLSLGFLDLGKIPRSLHSFRGENANARNIDPDLDVHFDAVLGYVVRKVSVQHILMLGLHAINDGLLRTSDNVHDNGGFFIGFGLGIGGAR
ncbi:MAG: hypothetical protein KC486_05220 [Myxococcales bacterium]|nr:hypothetical protein [Myxococcales bacterium]